MRPPPVDGVLSKAGGIPPGPTMVKMGRVREDHVSLLFRWANPRYALLDNILVSNTMSWHGCSNGHFCLKPTLERKTAPISASVEVA